MSPVDGTRQRIMAQHRYQPESNRKAFRSQRIDAGEKGQRTHKKRGDKILTSSGFIIVKKQGWL